MAKHVLVDVDTLEQIAQTSWKNEPVKVQYAIDALKEHSPAVDATEEQMKTINDVNEIVKNQIA